MLRMYYNHYLFGKANMLFFITTQRSLYPSPAWFTAVVVFYRSSIVIAVGWHSFIIGHMPSHYIILLPPLSAQQLPFHLSPFILTKSLSASTVWKDENNVYAIITWWLSLCGIVQFIVHLFRHQDHVVAIIKWIEYTGIHWNKYNLNNTIIGLYSDKRYEKWDGIFIHGYEILSVVLSIAVRIRF